MKKHGVIVACAVVAVMNSRPVSAQVPVEDQASIAMNLAQWVKNAGQMATQISQLANLVNLTTLMTTALGDSLGGGLAALMGESRVAFSRVTGAYGSVMRAPQTIENELALLDPSSFGDMTLPQMLARAERIRRMTQGTAAANTAMAAERAQQSMVRDQMQLRANEMKWNAVGSLGALQALGEQAGVANEFGKQTLESVNGIGTSLDTWIQHQVASEEMAIQMAKDDEQAMRDRLARGAGRPSSDLATW